MNGTAMMETKQRRFAETSPNRHIACMSIATQCAECADPILPFWFPKTWTLTDIRKHGLCAECAKPLGDLGHDPRYRRRKMRRGLPAVLKEVQRAAEARTGPGRPRTPRPYRYHADLRDWSGEVKDRDGECVRCGGSPETAHHVAPKHTHPDTATSLENGETLCRDCHQAEHPELPAEFFS